MSKVKDSLGFVPTIYLDDGHGEDTPGKRTPEFPDGSGVILENEFNRACMDYLAVFAEEIGFRVVKVAPELTDVSLPTRTKRANGDYVKMYPADNRPDKAAIYVSVHFNAFRGKWDETKGGAETHYYPGSVKGKLLAEKVQHWLFRGTEQENRGIKATNFHVLRETAMPAILVENGFMDVLKEARLMRCMEFQKEQARDILRGICDYYGLDYIAMRDGATDSKKDSEPKKDDGLDKQIADLKAANEKLTKQLESVRNIVKELEKALA